ncbi:hypothetical protein [Gallionella capsiferriformans]|jgi:hypothetical protein|uniref:Uncharacterized protein n=1 Tax=Gallionella capsiferriformans (strain ES-2) TaxID=395494 RepID=D9SG72_GALCS|nr:hypothetical protein [Gallionella capsiferriformans]ADL55519.1 hypothetical protein Galf_1500 [Gallionella capsiferriformans ES-2]
MIRCSSATYCTSIAVGEWGNKLDRLKEVVATMGRILAYDQLRAAGRSGAASSDELIDFARRDDWQACWQQ